MPHYSQYILDTNFVLLLCVLSIGSLVVWYIRAPRNVAPNSMPEGTGTSDESAARRRRFIHEMRGGIATEAAEGDSGGEEDTRETSSQVVLTSTGPVQVTTFGDPQSRIVFLTVHGVATNHQISWSSFQQLSKNIGSFRKACFVHMDLCGHQAHAGNFTEDVSMESLGHQVVEVATRLDIESAIGLGVGAGVNVLLHAYLQQRSILGALVAVGGTRWPITVNERFHYSLLELSLRAFGMNAFAKRILVGFHMSYNAKQRPITRDYRRDLDDMNARNIVKYLQAYRRRPAFTAQQTKQLAKLAVLSVAGNSVDGAIPLVPGYNPVPAAMDLYAALDVRVSDRCVVRGVGDWVNVESPHSLIKPMLYFLQVQGYSVH